MRLRVRKGRGRLAAGLGALLIVAGAVGAWTATRSAGTPTSAPTTVAATTGTIRQTVSATGTIEPAVQSTLSFTVSGTVDDVPVAVGDTVTKGAALASVDDADLRSAVELAQAALDAATEQQTAAESAARPPPRSRPPPRRSPPPRASSPRRRRRWTPRRCARRSPAPSPRSPCTRRHRRLRLERRVGRGRRRRSGQRRRPERRHVRRDRSTWSSSRPSSWVVDAVVGSADLASVKKGLQAADHPDRQRPPGSSARSQSVGIVASSTRPRRVPTFPVIIAVTGNPAGMYAGASANVSIIVKQVAGRPHRAHGGAALAGGTDVRPAGQERQAGADRR